MKRTAGRQRGVIMILAGILLPAMLAFAALAVDAGYLWLTKNQLQTEADAAALAGAAELPGDENQAIFRAGDYIRRNLVFGRVANPDNIDVGRWEKGQFFTDGNTAVKVDLSIKMGLFFAKIFGKPDALVVARATAARGAGDRNISLVLDRSGSMAFPINGTDPRSKMEILQASTDQFLTTVGGMRGNSAFGLASFSSDGRVDVTLQDQQSNFQQVRTAVRNMRPEASTCLACGISYGNDVLDDKNKNWIPGGKRVMIYLTDGVANDSLTDPARLNGCPADPTASAICLSDQIQGVPRDPDARKHPDTTIFTIGFGSDADDAALTRMSSEVCQMGNSPKADQPCHFHVESQADLDEVYRRIGLWGPIQLVD